VPRELTAYAAIRRRNGRSRSDAFQGSEEVWVPGGGPGTHMSVSVYPCEKLVPGVSSAVLPTSPAQLRGRERRQR
jgi:hypothetical protein